eukprot:jgi/Tetstr1/421872/TSEL_012772.t1
MARCVTALTGLRVVVLCGVLALATAKEAPSAEEKQALLALMQDLSGGGNRNFDSWRDDKDHCWWEGIFCSSDGRVTHLDLYDWGLQGSIPSTVTRLAQLEVLGLDHNILAGTIPPEMSKLTALQSIHLSHAHISGRIPPELSTLTSLSYLSFAANNLTGSIPPQLSTLSRLNVLSLEDNQLTSRIPAELSACHHLQDLYLDDNQLTGRIPKELSTLNLLNLVLNDNQLTGTIPLEFSAMISLEELALQGNYLSGNLYRNVREIGWQYMELLELVPQQLKPEQDLPSHPPPEMASATPSPLTLEPNLSESKMEQPPVVNLHGEHIRAEDEGAGPDGGGISSHGQWRESRVSVIVFAVGVLVMALT